MSELQAVYGPQALNGPQALSGPNVLNGPSALNGPQAPHSPRALFVAQAPIEPVAAGQQWSLFGRVALS